MTRQPTEPAEPSYTIPEFCRLERISEPYYYAVIRPQGLVREMRHLSGMVRISPEARAEFHRRMENPSPEMAEALAVQAARRQTHAREAAAKSAASPNHISNLRRGKHMGQPTAPPPKRKRARREV